MAGVLKYTKCIYTQQFTCLKEKKKKIQMNFDDFIVLVALDQVYELV
jgi:hypothetical protein